MTAKIVNIAWYRGLTANLEAGRRFYRLWLRCPSLKRHAGKPILPRLIGVDNNGN